MCHSFRQDTRLGVYQAEAKGIPRSAARAILPKDPSASTNITSRKLQITSTYCESISESSLEDMIHIFTSALDPPCSPSRPVDVSVSVPVHSSSRRIITLCEAREGMCAYVDRDLTQPHSAKPS
jgi:hypothetical protein